MINIFNIFKKKESKVEEVQTKEPQDYDQLIKEMKLAKKMNDTIRQEIFEKAESFEKSIQQLKKNKKS
jgi:hypothetical protein